MKNSADIKKSGAHLRKLGDKAGLSQQQLADMAEIAKIKIKRIELAKFTVTLDVMVFLAKALEIPLEELVNYKKFKNQV